MRQSSIGANWIDQPWVGWELSEHLWQRPTRQSSLLNQGLMDSTEVKELLRATTAFSILSDEELNYLADRFELVHYTLGQPVVRAGGEADGFFVVYSGRARVIETDNICEEVTG